MRIQIGVLRFARPTATVSSSSTSTPATAAALVAAATMATATTGRPVVPVLNPSSFGQPPCPTITVMAEPSSGDIEMRTSTTNEAETTTWTSPSPDEEEAKRRLELIIKEELRYEVSDYDEDESDVEPDLIINTDREMSCPYPRDKIRVKFYSQDADGNMLDGDNNVDELDLDDDYDMNTRI